MGSEYHKINSVFKRDMATRHKTFTAEYADPVFAYLCNAPWRGTEKIDGTNIRVEWDGTGVSFGGKTDNAQIPAKLIGALREMFTPEKMLAAFGDKGGLTLYGEGYGAGIQSGGIYRPDQSFILFDISGGGTFFEHEKVSESAAALNIDMVADVAVLTLVEWVETIRSVGVQSRIAPAKAEGVVLRPTTELRDRFGNRIITKLKAKDFAHEQRSEMVATA